jgi:hypothetical protein
MIELGALHADIPDTGKTRINLPSGGLIEPVTASAVSRLGQRITFVVQDQTESWTKQNAAAMLADNQRRGLAGMGGRWLETPNAWDPAEELRRAADLRRHEVGVYLDDVDPGPGSVRNKADRRRMLRKVYGDSWWVDLDRIDGEIVALLDRDPAQAERWFLNRKLAGEDAAFDPARVGRAHVTTSPPGAPDRRRRRRRPLRRRLALVATEVDTGHQWPLGIWERRSPPDDYEHPSTRSTARSRGFERFYVWRVYVDPQYIEDWLDTLAGPLGREARPAVADEPARQMAWPCATTPTRSPPATSPTTATRLRRHIGNARGRSSTSTTTSTARCTRSPRTPDSRKIDAAPWPPSQLGSARRRDRRRRQEAPPQRRLPLTALDRRPLPWRTTAHRPPGSRSSTAHLDERWLRRLTGMGVCDAYYEGDHKLAFATAKFREAFGGLFARSPTTGCRSSSKLQGRAAEVQGFRFGKKPGADEAAWDIWQANGLDAESDMRTPRRSSSARRTGSSSPRHGDDPPRITAEHPSQ